MTIQRSLVRHAEFNDAALIGVVLIYSGEFISFNDFPRRFLAVETPPRLPFDLAVDEPKKLTIFSLSSSDSGGEPICSIASLKPSRTDCLTPSRSHSKKLTFISRTQFSLHPFQRLPSRTKLVLFKAQTKASHNCVCSCCDTTSTYARARPIRWL